MGVQIGQQLDRNTVALTKFVEEGKTEMIIFTLVVMKPLL